LTPEHATLAQDQPFGEGDVHVWVVPLDDPDKKRRRELAHLAEGIVLASYLGVTPAMLEHERGPGGKPRLRGEPLQYNLSHSERVALVGVSRELALGVDVQGPHPTTEKSWFAKRICSAREYEYFGGAPGADDLLRLWARKEAVIKARGEGSYVAVGEIDVLDMEIDGGWLCLDIPGTELADWPGFHAAVAFRDRPDLRAAPPGISLTVRDFAWR
jgi:hypothetical protein